MLLIPRRCGGRHAVHGTVAALLDGAFDRLGPAFAARADLTSARVTFTAIAFAIGGAASQAG